MERDLAVKWPEEWTGGPFSVNEYTSLASSTALISVVRDSPEWQTVEKEWRNGHGESGRSFQGELVKVERVQNARAWEAYYSRVLVLAARSKAHFPPGSSLFRRANEQWMKHGSALTSPLVMLNRFEEGLICRYSGRGPYGFALHTADDAHYVDASGNSYSSSSRSSSSNTAETGGNGNNGVLNQMFLVRVAAGEQFEMTSSNRALVAPPGGCDSVRGLLGGPDFLGTMVYQPDSAYPAYLLTYKKSAK